MDFVQIYQITLEYQTGSFHIGHYLESVIEEERLYAVSNTVGGSVSRLERLQKIDSDQG